MQVKTTRFGVVEVEDGRVLKFPEGILGFPDHHEFVLMQTDIEGNFFWLQSVDRPELAFVVCDPLLFVPDYNIPAKTDDFERIGLASTADLQVFIIVNKVNRLLTGNLQGPLAINAQNRCGRQLILSEKKYNTRHPLMNLDVQTGQISKTA